MPTDSHSVWFGLHPQRWLPFSDEKFSFYWKPSEDLHFTLRAFYFSTIASFAPSKRNYIYKRERTWRVHTRFMGQRSWVWIPQVHKQNTDQFNVCQKCGWLQCQDNLYILHFQWSWCLPCLLTFRKKAWLKKKSKLEQW